MAFVIEKWAGKPETMSVREGANSANALRVWLEEQGLWPRVKVQDLGRMALALHQGIAYHARPQRPWEAN